MTNEFPFEGRLNNTSDSGRRDVSYRFMAEGTRRSTQGKPSSRDKMKALGDLTKLKRTLADAIFSGNIPSHSFGQFRDLDPSDKSSVINKILSLITPELDIPQTTRAISSASRFLDIAPCISAEKIVRLEDCSKFRSNQNSKQPMPLQAKIDFLEKSKDRMIGGQENVTSAYESILLDTAVRYHLDSAKKSKYADESYLLDATTFTGKDRKQAIENGVLNLAIYTLAAFYRGLRVDGNIDAYFCRIMKAADANTKSAYLGVRKADETNELPKDVNYEDITIRATQKIALLFEEATGLYLPASYKQNRSQGVLDVLETSIALLKSAA